MVKKVAVQPWERIEVAAETAQVSRDKINNKLSLKTAKLYFDIKSRTMTGNLSF